MKKTNNEESKIQEESKLSEELEERGSSDSSEVSSSEEFGSEESTSTTSDESSASSEESSESDEETTPTIEEYINQYKQEKEEYENRYLRLMAEFDNYRKRVLKEKSDLILNGSERVLTTLLPVLDDIERAEVDMLANDDIASLKEGVHLIFDKLKDTLSKQGLTKIDSVGEPFNVDYHEAVAMVPGQPEELHGKVIDCIQEGYKLNDKVIRHSKVAVAE